MGNYLTLNGKRIDLTDEQVREVERAFWSQESTCCCEPDRIKLSEIAVGDTFKIGEHEFVVLEHCVDLTRIILKGLLPERSAFGKNNNFSDDECVIREKLENFAAEIGAIIGEGNLVEHCVDLTSDDGLDDYGEVEAKMSLLTCNLYRKYVRILDKHKLDSWWWLITPYSTPTHEDSDWIKCVSPSGDIGLNIFNGNRGVRPFCILKSNIFVSK